jgi:hypothetical protein
VPTGRAASTGGALWVRSLVLQPGTPRRGVATDALFAHAAILPAGGHRAILISKTLRLAGKIDVSRRESLEWARPLAFDCEMSFRGFVHKAPE